MTRVLRFLASFRLVVPLLTVLLVCLAAGTIIDSTRGANVAMRTVYGALWFKALLGLFSASLLASLVRLWPWSRHRIGFVLTHGSMLIILGGSLVTDIAKVEGRMVIEEGGLSRTLTGRSDASGRTQPDIVLPFALRLHAFEIDTYDGTDRPAMFRSRVTVEDSGKDLAATIEMNRELAYGGYRFFQSSYEKGPDRDTTILSVSRDPGQPVVFAGYLLLVSGLLVILGTRATERRRRDIEETALQGPSIGTSSALAIILAAALSGSATPALATSVPTDTESDALRALAVQHDGRVMPLDTLAREAAFHISGRSPYGLEATAFVLGLAFDPSGWANEPILPVDRDLAVAMSLPPGTKRVSFRAAVASQAFRTLAQDGHERTAGGQPVPPLVGKAMRLEERLFWMQGFFDQTLLRVLPGPQRGDRWTTPGPVRLPRDLATLRHGIVLPPHVSEARLAREVLLNRARPARLAWIVLTLSALLAAAAWRASRRILDGAAFALLLSGFGIMTWGLAMRWNIAERIPASNMYESLLFLGWGTGVFAVIATTAFRNRLVVQNAATLSAITMALTDLLPIDPFIHPVAPVLNGTPWLAIHVPIIMLSYAVLGLAVLVAHMQIGLTLLAPARKDLVPKLVDLVYWYTHVGTILLITGILTGSVWAASSWGRYWGWDPKEVWSLVAFLAYMAILHARFDRTIGPFGVAAWSIAAFWTILMTYIGVNYILATGLHSYGFGGGTVARWLGVVASLEIAFLLAGYWRHRHDRAIAS